MNNSTPIFRHDCTHCIYLGLYAKVGEPFADLYVCVDEEHPVWSSFIARYSDEPSDYRCSSVQLGLMHPALEEAVKRSGFVVGFDWISEPRKKG